MMTKLLMVAAIVGLAASSAQACESTMHSHSAKATKLDQTTVASVTVPQSEAVVVTEAATEEKAPETPAK